MNHEDLRGMAKPKGLPKSLHTVRILANIARDLAQRGELGSSINPDTAILAAVRVCGYGDCTPDPHGLREKAAAEFAKTLNQSRRAA